MQEVVAKGDESLISELLAKDVQFMPPTYYSTWTGRANRSRRCLGHVMFRSFRIFAIAGSMGEGNDWALEFQCKVGEMDAVGADLITLNDEGPDSATRSRHAPTQNHRRPARSHEWRGS